jgi:hypothetical protein
VRGVPVLLAVASAALLCSLSPERNIGGFTFVRPSAFLYEMAPMFRAYARFGVVVGLMTALLAGAGASYLWHSPSRTLRRMAVVLVALAAVEFAPFPPWRFREVLPTRAHRFLAAKDGPLKVLDCVNATRVSDTLGASFTGHDVAFLGGPDFDDCGEPQFADKLRAKGFTHVIARRDTPFGSRLTRNPLPRGLTAGPAFSDSSILEVKTEPPAAYATAWIDFYPREYEGRRSWRWMKQTGSLRVVPAGAVETTRNLEIELRAFPDRRVVDWFINGERRGEIEVTAEWRSYVLTLGSLPPGPATVTFACREGAVVANDVLHNHDPRALTLAVSNWTLAETEGGGRTAFE